jgi:hypothetical protein
MAKTTFDFKVVFGLTKNHRKTTEKPPKNHQKPPKNHFEKPLRVKTPGNC